MDGCHGRLNYKTGGEQQIWIAGGIGVTPFLSWVRDFDANSEFEIDFFYTVRSEADALFWDEFAAAAGPAVGISERRRLFPDDRFEFR